jgi:transposase
MQSEPSVVGIDLAKSIFHLVGMDERGKILLRKRLARGEVIPFMAKLPRVLVGMEARGGTHDWGWQLRAQGHEVKLMAPQYVKPYVKTNKNGPRSRRRPLSATQHNPTTPLVDISFHSHET